MPLIDDKNIVTVGVGNLKIAKSPKIIKTSLGSCLGVVLYDSINKIGGLLHLMLPKRNDRDGKLSKYADTGIPLLVDHLKKIITFRRFNLMVSNYPFKNPFDFIFCRNVMIYFDSDTQHRLISKFYDCLPKDGYLFIGHSETLAKRTHGFKYIQSAVYQK